MSRSHEAISAAHSGPQESSRGKARLELDRTPSEKRLLPLFRLRHFAGGSETGDPVLYLPGRDILETWRNERLLDRFCDILEENTLKFIPLPVAGMLILRSIATVFPYDTYLGRHYLSQYIAARDALTEDDRSLLVDIKEKGLPRIDDTYSDAVRRFLKIERKLYTQFSH